MTSPLSDQGANLEIIPPNETQLIDQTAAATKARLDKRYTGGARCLRGVHPKDHGCVEAAFTVAPDLAPEYRVGVFRNPGAEYRAAIRFSNATTSVTPDSPQELGPPPGFAPMVGPDGKPVLAHGSRGMAIKLYGVDGNRLQPRDGERTQDFLMINQPVFAFANAEDYAVMSALIVDNDAKAALFFARAQPVNPMTGQPNPPDVIARAAKSLAIVREVKSLSVAAPPPMPPFPSLPYPYQAPPLSPLDNRYFSAAPFGFGPGRAMKFSAVPVNPMAGELGAAIDDPDYLRAAMRRRMAEAGGRVICFDFQVQVRGADTLKLADDIENVCTLWDEAKYPFVTVARITIPAQDVSSPERQEFCETLFYTPWHGLEDHRPLGGINRLRQKVYETSSGRRGCPVSPELPAKMGRATPGGGPPGGLGGKVRPAR